MTINQVHKRFMHFNLWKCYVQKDASGNDSWCSLAFFYYWLPWLPLELPEYCRWSCCCLVRLSKIELFLYFIRSSLFMISCWRRDISTCSCSSREVLMPGTFGTVDRNSVNSSFSCAIFAFTSDGGTAIVFCWEESSVSLSILNKNCKIQIRKIANFALKQLQTSELSHKWVKENPCLGLERWQTWCCFYYDTKLFQKWIIGFRKNDWSEK